MRAYKRIAEFERQLEADARARGPKEYFAARPWWVAKDTWDGGWAGPGDFSSPHTSLPPAKYIIKLLQLRLPHRKMRSIQVLRNATGYNIMKSRDIVNTLEQIRKSHNPNPNSVVVEVLGMTQDEWVEFSKWFEFGSTNKKSKKKPTPLQLYLVTGVDMHNAETQFLVLAENEVEARDAAESDYVLLCVKTTECTEVKGPFKNGTILMLKHVV
jgi:hypothetical protein